MLPVQEYFIEKISGFRLTKNDIARAIDAENASNGKRELKEFFSSPEPDINTARKIASVLCMTDEEFEELWYKTKDQAVRRKIKAKIRDEKLNESRLKVA
jgi:DNA-binding XRE family transcriptional regulator